LQKKRDVLGRFFCSSVAIRASSSSVNTHIIKKHNYRILLFRYHQHNNSKTHTRTEFCHCFFTASSSLLVLFVDDDVKEVLEEVQVPRFSWFEVEVLLLHLAALASRP